MHSRCVQASDTGGLFMKSKKKSPSSTSLASRASANASQTHFLQEFPPASLQDANQLLTLKEIQEWFRQFGELPDELPEWLNEHYKTETVGMTVCFLVK